MDYHSTRNPPLRKLVDEVRSKRLAFREVVFMGTFDSPVAVVLENFLFAPAPHLRSLDLVVHGGCVVGNGDPNSQHAGTNSVATPNLTSVRLVGVSIPWNAAILRGLRSLSLIHLCRSRPKGKAPTLGEIAEILQGCPDLEHLTLRTNLWGLSLRPTCDILQCIQYPQTATLSVRIDYLEDDWQADLGVIISQLPQNWITAPIQLKADLPRMTLSAKNLELIIPSPNEEGENTGSRIAYKELFSSLGAPILATITSLHIDTLASQNSTAILTATNELFPNLTKLSISPYQRLKSKKPWHVVLEKVVQSTEEINGPVCLCPNLTSLELTATNHDCPDLLSILQLIRIRSSDIKFKGKGVKKSPITLIVMNIDSSKLSSEQLGLLNELKGEVADVRCAK
ncbi:hypothetical protein M407DRAFT_33402 [Tulasnella calospora MUT 4182]|uniref:F-box domain-containing protein n=1 Tax=Tulasnella calospora MUT 4182 TaxID=1051891 RepID=A0A0C3K6F4_9AGAM|nr:hypothetical protein M407DRAFT_33402 [Tulasnella calospora MUT 4182]